MLFSYVFNLHCIIIFTFFDIYRGTYSFTGNTRIVLTERILKFTGTRTTRTVLPNTQRRSPAARRVHVSSTGTYSFTVVYVQV